MTTTDVQETINNMNRTVKKAIANFTPPESLTVAEWSNKYRKLSPENSAEPGRWKTSRTPYLEEIMNAFTDPKVHRIAVAASSQVGKTEVELNMLGYAIDIDPGPIMFVMPTVDVAKDFSKRRLAPMIRDTGRLRSKVAAAKSRDGENTVLKKSYPGGMLTLTGSNSSASLASVPARYVFGDERDRWAKDANGEGDPWGLVEARTITFYNYKMVEVSTPTIKGCSAIEASFNLGTQEYWCVECPHCHEYNFIKFDHIRFKNHSTVINGKRQYIVDSVEYACPSCGCASSENEIRKQPKKWIAQNPDAYKNGTRSFWINAFSSPWMSWSKLVLKFLQAKNEPEKLKTVFNTLFGELWEDRGDLEDEEGMLGRREEYKAELPDGVLCLTCGVDTQDNRLEYEVVGYGFHEENWGIEKGIIMGKPSEADVWERLDGIIDRSWHFENGKSLKISLTFVDSGGHYTQEVYEECSKRINKRVFAVKGKGGEGIPYTTVPSKANIVKDNIVIGKTWLYIIGVDAGKERIMSGLKVQQDGARKSHFPSNEDKGYDAVYFAGLLSEKMVYKNGKWTWEKLPGHERNEALDCRDYANAAFKTLKPNLDAIYARLKEIRKKAEEKPKLKKQSKKTYTDEGW
ncbi:MAG: phage terminase large subunit family protein [bacterium]|nr:phage terminase large subunit family protein [bacterium]